MKIKKLIAACAAVLIAVLLITLGVTTPYVVTTEIVSLDELREMGAFDVDYLPCIHFLHAVDNAEEDLDLPGPAAFGNVYITRSSYFLAADRITISAPVAAQYAPADEAGWGFDFQMLSIAWANGMQTEADIPNVEQLSLQVSADPGVYLGYPNRNPFTPSGSSEVLPKDRMIINDERKHRFLFSISNYQDNAQPTAALWDGEFVIRQGLRSQRFVFSLTCITEYGGQPLP